MKPLQFILSLLLFAISGYAAQLMYPEQNFHIELPEEYEWFEIESPKLGSESVLLFVTEKEQRIFLMVARKTIPGGGSVKDEDIKEGFESGFPKPTLTLEYSTFLGRESAVYNFTSTSGEKPMHNQTTIVMFGEEAFAFSLMSSDRDILDEWDIGRLVKNRVDPDAGINSVAPLHDTAPSSGKEMETAEIIDPGFSVADAEDVSISTAEGGLEVEFEEWNEKKKRIFFVDAISHSWHAIDWKCLDGERYDCTHIIHNSEWLKEHLSQRSVEENEGYKHYRLNFNAEGTLQVLARDLKVKT